MAAIALLSCHQRSPHQLSYRRSLFLTSQSAIIFIKLTNFGWRRSPTKAEGSGRSLILSTRSTESENKSNTLSLSPFPVP
ncbi:MAG: hypothetical protein ACFB4I_16220 [Cyanophyceae cyanobacterium]